MRNLRVAGLLLTAAACSSTVPTSNNQDPGAPPESQATATLRGTVRLEAALKHGGATVAVSQGTATTGDSGAFTITDLKPGAAEAVRFSYLDGNLYEDVIFDTPELQIGSVIDLGVVILPLRRGNLSGTVRLEGSDDAGEARITLRREEALPGGTPVEDSRVTRADGVYVFDTLPVGRYEIEGSRDGFTTRRDSVVITQGDTTEAPLLVLQPMSGVLTLEDGARFADRHAVDFSISGESDDVEEMRLSEDPAFDGVAWEPFQSSGSFALSEGDGAKVLYLKLRGGGATSGTIQANIFVDATAPSQPRIELAGGAAWYGADAGDTLSATFDALELGSGLVRMQVSQDGVVDTEPPEDYVQSRVIAFDAREDGTQSLRAVFFDRAGNRSEEAVATIGRDTTPPEVSRFSINGGAAFTGDARVRLDIEATDLSGVASMRVSNLGDAAVRTLPFIASLDHTLLPLDYANTTRSVQLVLVDLAGNASAPVTASIELDDRGALSGTLALDLVGAGFDGISAVVDGVPRPVSVVPHSEDSGATFTIREVPSGPNRAFELRKQGFVSVAPDARFTVQPGVTTQVGHFQLARERGAIAGVVRVDGRNDHTGVIVELLSLGRVVLTDAAGRFSFEGVPEGGPYSVAVRLDEQHSRELFSEVTVAPGETTQLSTAEQPILLRRLAGAVSVAGSGYTQTPEVTLQLRFDGTNEYRASEQLGEGGEPDAEWQVLSGGQESYPFVLDAAGEDGRREIFVQFRNTTPGQEILSETRSAEVILDRAAPADGQLEVAGRGFTQSQVVTLALAAVEPFGLDSYQLAFTDDAPTDADFDPWREFAASVTVNLPFDLSFREVRLHVRYRDRAGNVSEPTSGRVILDPSAPANVGVVLAPDAQDAGATHAAAQQVEVLLLASDDSPLEMRLSEDATLFGAPWQAFQARVTWVFSPSPQGERRVHVQFRDLAGNESAVVSDDIILDTLLPPAPVVTRISPPETNQLEVELRFENVTDVDVVDVELDFDSGFPQPERVGRVSTTTATLGGADGEKRIFVRYVDAAGNRGAGSSVTFVLDTQAPLAPALVIAGEGFTRSRDIEVQLAAIGAQEVRLSESSDCSGGNYELFTPLREFELAQGPGDGERTISARFRDAAGNESECVSRSVVLDTEAPQFGLEPFIIEEGAALTASTLVTLDFDVTGAHEMRLSNQPTQSDATWEPFRSTVIGWRLLPGDGDKTVYAAFRDLAGNATDIIPASITLDTTGDITGGVVLEGSSDLTGLEFRLNNQTVNATLQDNRFTIEDVTVDFYDRLRILREGYDEGRVQGVQVRPGEVTDVGIVELRLARGGIEGWIRLAGEDNQSGVFVELLNTSHTTQTNSAGYFLLQNVVARDEVYELVARKEGFATERRSVEVRSGFITELAPQLQPLTLRVLQGDFDIDGGADYSADLEVELDLDSDAVRFRMSESDVFVVNPDDASVPFADFVPGVPVSFTLADFDGPHTIYVQFEQSNGDRETAQASIIVDRIAPAAASVLIEGGLAATRNPVVEVRLSATDENELRLMSLSSNGVDYEAPVPFTPNRTVSFAGDDGERCVFARFFDGAGNESAPVSDCIEVDRAPPVLGAPPILVENVDGFVRGVDVLVAVSASGATQMKLANFSDFPGAEWGDYVGELSLPWTLLRGDGPKRVFVAFRDAAGNTIGEDGSVFFAVELDTTPPPQPAFVVVEGGLVNVQTLQLDLLNSDGVAVVEVGSDRDPVGIEVPAADRVAYSIPAVNGDHRIVVAYRDAAGNRSREQSAVISYDDEAPAGLRLVIIGGEVTRQAQVSLEITATGANEIALSNSLDFSSAVWEPFATFRPAWPLDTTSDGEKTVYLKARDAAGNESAVIAEATVTYDATPPSIAAFAIDAGAAFTAQRGVLLTVDASDVFGIAGMRLTNAGSFTGEALLGLEPERAWSLSAGPDGERTVLLEIVDRAGNRASRSATISLDQTAPTILAASIADGAQAVAGLTVNVEVIAEDPPYPAASLRYELSESSVFDDAALLDYPLGGVSRAFTLAAGDGARNVEVRVVDLAGNETRRTLSVVVDTEAPSGGVEIAGGAEFTANNATTLALSYSSDTTQMALVVGDAPDCGAQNYAPVQARVEDFALDDVGVDGTYTVWACFRDEAGNTSAPSSDTVVLDATVPASTQIAIATPSEGDAATHSASQEVELLLGAQDDNALEMRIGELPSLATSNWQAFAPRVSWIFSPTPQGRRTVYVRFRDAAGNMSEVISDDIELDTVLPPAPVLSRVDALHTRSTTVGVRFENVLDADVAAVEVASDASFTNLRTLGREPSSDIELALPDGEKEVFARYVDAAGNRGPAGSLTFLLDTRAPEAPSITIVEGAIASSFDIELALSAVGASELRVSQTTDCSGGDWQAMTTLLPFALSQAAGDGRRTVSAVFRDLAGNESACVSDRVRVDTTAPALGAIPIVIDGDAPVTAATLVTLDFDVTGATQMKVSNQPALTDAEWEPFRNPVLGWRLPEGDGTKTVYAMFRDGAGNETAIVPDSIELDTTGTITGALLLERAGELTGLTFSLDGQQVTPLIDANRFTIDEVTVGQYNQLRIEKDGYDAGLVPNVNVGPGEVTEVGTVELRLSRGGVEGWVRLAGELNNGGVFIELLNTSHTTQTNSAGFFLLEDVVARDEAYELVARKDGFATERRTVIVNSGLVTQLTTEAVPLSLRVLADDFEIDGGAPFTADLLVDLFLDTDAVRYRASESDVFFLDPNDATIPFVDFVPGQAIEFPLEDFEGLHTVFVQLEKSNGDREVAQAEITVDRIAPTGGNVLVEGGALATRNDNVLVTFSAEDENELQLMTISTDGTNFELPTPFQPTRTIGLAGDDGEKCVYARFVDGAGNESDTAVDCVDLDRAPPELGAPPIAISNDGGFVRGTGVELTLSAVGATQMRLSNFPTFTNAQWETYVGGVALPWTLLVGDGDKRVYVAFRDAAQNTIGGNGSVFAEVSLDATPPPRPTFIVVQGAVVRTLDIDVDLLNTGDATQVEIASNRGGTATLLDIADRVTYSLPDVSGDHTLTVRYLDAAGNASTPQSSVVTFDDDPPTGLRLVILGPEVTNQTRVDLEIEATGADEMRLSNRADFAGSEWEPFATFRPDWLLDVSSQGRTSVFLEVRDAAGNESESAASRSVNFDSLPPTIDAFTIDEGAGFATTRSVLLGVQSSDANGVVAMRLTNAGSFTNEPEVSLEEARSWTLAAGADGQRTVLLEVIDQAGNRSSGSANIILDQTLPRIIEASVDDGAEFSRDATVVFTLSAEDPPFAADQLRYELRNDDDFRESGLRDYVDGGVTRNHVLLAGAGLKTLWLRVVDAAGNETRRNLQITRDTSNPNGSMQLDDGAAYTTNRRVRVALDYPGDVVEVYAEARPDGQTGIFCSQIAEDQWIPAERVLNGFALTDSDDPATDGGYRVWACYRDASGRTARTDDSIILDRTPPAATLTLAGGSEAISTATVNWEVSGASNDLAGVVVGEALNCNAAIFADLQLSGNYTLTPGDGGKTVTLCLQDRAGLIGEATDFVLFDTEAPTGTLTINGGAERSGSITVSVTASELDDVAWIKLGAEQADCNSAPGYVPIDTTSYTEAAFALADADGLRTVVACLRDPAGNTNPIADSIVVDRVGPGGGFILESGDSHTNGRWVTATFGGFEADAVSYRLKVDDAIFCTTGNFTNLDAGVPTIRLDNVDGAQTVIGCLKDDLGNVSELPAQQIILDRAAPSVPPDLRLFVRGAFESSNGTSFIRDGESTSDPLPRAQANRSTDNVTAQRDIRYTTELARSALFNQIIHTLVQTDLARIRPPENLDDGDWFVRVRAEDQSGLTSETGVVGFTIDTTSPSAPEILSDFEARENDTVTVEWRTTQPADTTDYRFRVYTTASRTLLLDEIVTGTTRELVKGVDLLPASGRLITISVAARDLLKNEGLATETSFHFDDRAPCHEGQNWKVDGGAAYNTSGTVTIEVICNGEQPTLMRVSCDGEVSAANDLVSYQQTSTCVLNTADGQPAQKTVDIAVYDDAGNATSFTSKTIIFDDEAPPAPTLTPAAATGVNHGCARLGISAESADHDAWEIRVNGGAWEEASKSGGKLRFEPLQQAVTNLLEVRERDLAGNVSPSTLAFVEEVSSTLIPTNLTVKQVCDNGRFAILKDMEVWPPVWGLRTSGGSNPHIGSSDDQVQLAAVPRIALLDLETRSLYEFNGANGLADTLARAEAPLAPENYKDTVDVACSANESFVFFNYIDSSGGIESRGKTRTVIWEDPISNRRSGRTLRVGAWNMDQDDGSGTEHEYGLAIASVDAIYILNSGTDFAAQVTAVYMDRDGNLHNQVRHIDNFVTGSDTKRVEAPLVTEPTNLHRTVFGLARAGSSSIYMHWQASGSRWRVLRTDGPGQSVDGLRNYVESQGFGIGQSPWGTHVRTAQYFHHSDTFGILNRQIVMAHRAGGTRVLESYIATRDTPEVIGDSQGSGVDFPVGFDRGDGQAAWVDHNDFSSIRFSDSYADQDNEQDYRFPIDVTRPIFSTRQSGDNAPVVIYHTLGFGSSQGVVLGYTDEASCFDP